MRLLFKQRFTLGLDKYDIYNEQGETVFSVRSRFAWGRKFEIYDRGGNFVATLIGKAFTWFPTFEMYIGNRFAGRIQKKFTWFKPEFIVDCNGWHVEGNFWEFNYRIIEYTGRTVATIDRGFSLMDSYVLDIYDDADALAVLMLVIAIDAEKDNRNNY